MKSQWRRTAAWLALALLVAMLDQFSKMAVATVLQPGQSIVVAPFFSLVLWFNKGAAFSFLANAAGWQRELLIGIALVASVVIVWMLKRHSAETLFCVALSLILGGALGNLWDRVLHGHVLDFLLFHAGTWYWPAFNLADSAITLGAGLAILDSFRHRPPA